MSHQRQGGMDYYPTDWTARCEAKCRKTGEQCPHVCSAQIGVTIAGTPQAGPEWFEV